LPCDEKETMMGAPEELSTLGQSLWLDNITRDLLDSGALARYVAGMAITGLTSNPTIFDRAIGGSGAYDDDIRELSAAGIASAEQLVLELAVQDLTRAADIFDPVHRRTAGIDGWVSLEVSPTLAYDTESTVAEAKALYAKADRPNLFIKIPGTPPGLAAIEEAIFAGVPVNVTLLFSPRQFEAAADAYMRGLERRVSAGLDLDVSSVASLFVSRWDKAVAERVPESLRNRLGIAVAAQAYAAYRDLLDTDRWQGLAGQGARSQRLLFASTGTKDPSASDVLYVDALIAPDTVNTVPEETLLAFADHGVVRGTLPGDGGDADEVLAEFLSAGVEVDALGETLQREGAEAFVSSWQHLCATVASRQQDAAGVA
jgi:transaldolase